MSQGPPVVAIVGTGLIGASLGLALRQRGVEVVGVESNAEHAAEALARGAVSRLAPLAAAVRQSEIVVLALPLDAVPAALVAVEAHARPGALVTDVGSVKGAVADQARRLSPTLRFVGGHPMAGAAVAGPSHADPLLFENATWVLCPPPGCRLRDDAPEVLWLVETVGARPVVMGAERHDAVVAAISHLPQLLAVALVEAAADAGDDALALAAGGFRDMTRIAGSAWSMWGPILADNREAVAAVLRAFEDRLRAVRHSVDAGDGALATAFERAGRVRAALPTTSRGTLAPLADVVVWADDVPGYLHALTGVLARAGLNLRDVELLRVRSGELGTFRFGFETVREADQAVATLAAAGYRAARR